MTRYGIPAVLFFTAAALAFAALYGRARRAPLSYSTRRHTYRAEYIPFTLPAYEWFRSPLLSYVYCGRWTLSRGRNRPPGAPHTPYRYGYPPVHISGPARAAMLYETR